MNKMARVNIERAELIISIYYGELAKKDIEMYPDLLEKPVYTPSGGGVMLTIEDVRRYSEPSEDERRSMDCGSRVYFRRPHGSLLGVCHNEKMRSGAEPAQAETNTEKEKTA